MDAGLRRFAKRRRRGARPPRALSGILHSRRAGRLRAPDRRSRAFPNKRRLWIIFHGKLRAFCALLAKEARRQGQGKVDSRGHPRAGHPVTIDHDAFAHWHRAEIARSSRCHRSRAPPSAGPARAKPHPARIPVNPACRVLPSLPASVTLRPVRDPPILAIRGTL